MKKRSVTGRVTGIDQGDRADGLRIRLSWPPRLDTPGASPAAHKRDYGARFRCRPATDSTWLDDDEDRCYVDIQRSHGPLTRVVGADLRTPEASAG